MAAAVLPSSAQTASALWGEHGEAWDPAGRLPDVSFAGYRSGEAPLPDVEVVANVLDFGAVGDGQTDSTAAFRRAIAQTDRGAILIPAGTYVLSDVLDIQKPHLVLRGEGQGKTVLRFVTQLQDVRPNMSATTGGRPTSRYSWSGGFIWVAGNYGGQTITHIKTEAKRGDHTFTVEDASGLSVGQRVQVEVLDDGAEQTLARHVYSEDPGGIEKLKNPTVMRLVTRIAAIDHNVVTIERPLRLDLRAAWSPRLKTFSPTVEEVGIESMTIDFPVRKYEGHFTEWGMNAIAINNASDCWVKDVQISNADSGIFLYSVFCTVDGLLVDSQRPPSGGGFTGHHGLTFGTDCLLQNFDFQTRFIHDLSVDNRSAGNVAKHGRGVEMSLDHHRKLPHDNLFSNLHVGTGKRIWKSGGGGQLGRHSAARNTFWNIDADADFAMPDARFGPPSLNLIGLRLDPGTVSERPKFWVEAISPGKLVPADLHAAQLQRRLNRD